MKLKRATSKLRDEIGKRYLETDIGRKELAEEYKLCLKTISNIIKEYREKMGVEK
jgi:DNA-binding transcriptional regulator LsrR (DeoR family)